MKEEIEIKFITTDGAFNGRIFGIGEDNRVYIWDSNIADWHLYDPMPEGEGMFYFHGYSGPCPKPPLPQPKEKKVKGWAVLGTQRNKGGLEHSHGWPMIFIQRTKPKVEIYGQFPPVVPCTISYTITKPKKKGK